MIEKALHFVAQGYKAIKMQVAHVHTPAQDLDNVRRMREAVGPDIDIMIDVNMGWSADVAIEMGRKFEQYNIYWLEEPVPADPAARRSEEHTSELQSLRHLVCRLLLE